MMRTWGVAGATVVLFSVFVFFRRRSRSLGQYERYSSEGMILKVLKRVAEVVDLIPFGPIHKKPSVDEICSQAQKKTGLSDFGTHTLWRQALEAYFDDAWAYNSPLQRLLCRHESTELLSKRLRVLNAFKQYPEAMEMELPRPVFIVGMPRTGSTILHQLLAEDSKAMSVPFWEWNDPVPPEKGQKDLRLQKAQEKVELTRKAIPIIDTLHLTEAHEADECYQGWIDFPYASDGNLKIIPWHYKSFELFWNTDVTELYKNERKILQLLLWQRQTSYDWTILKSPIHTISLDNLATAFPDSLFVWTHRDMKSVVCSFAGLCTLGFVRDHSAIIDMKECGRRALEMLDMLMRRGLEARKKLEEQNFQFVDFYFSDFIRSPIEAISQLYGLLGLPFTEEAEQQMQKFYQNSLEARKAAKKPTKFTLDEFGLDKDDIDRTFEYYYKQFPKVSH